MRADSATRRARVSGRFAWRTHSSTAFFAVAGNASKCARAPATAASACSKVVRHFEPVGGLERLPRTIPPGERHFLQAGRMHETGGHQTRHPDLVGRRPHRLRLAWRQPQHRALVVEPAGLAVDPAEAERFFDQVVVGEALPAARLLEVDEPHAAIARVVAFEPPAPGGARRRLCGVLRESCCHPYFCGCAVDVVPGLVHSFAQLSISATVCSTDSRAA